MFISFTLLFFILISAHIYLTNAFFSHLKNKHEDVWLELGQPRWRIHFGDQSFQDTMKYIRQKKFTHLNDEILETFYSKIKGLERISIAIAILILFITVWDILKG